LAVETGTTEQGNAVRLFPSGGEAPYSYSVTGTTRVHADGESGDGYVVENIYEPGDFIGSVDITVRDSNGAAATDSVKVLPAIPADFAVAATGGRDVKITWEYVKGGATGFRVERRDVLGEAFDTVGTVPASELVANRGSFTDGGLTPNQYFEYRLFAVTENGDYESMPTTPLAVQATN
jgi:hypothetical protein